MGLAGGGKGTPGVSSGALPLLWRFWLLLLVSVLEVEAQTAEDTKPIYIWQTGPWGRCMGSECGPGGSQSRAVWCAHSEGWTTLHTNCEHASRPHNQQGCFRVCDWHKDMYDWQLGAWNRCLPVAMRGSAGMQRYAAAAAAGVCTRGEEGLQTREVACVQKADAGPAEDAICEYFEPKPRLEQACLIPCPRDCVVSEFSAWTSCSKTCGTGLQNRIRWVLAPPLFGGETCPNLTEFHTCQPGLCEGEESLHSIKLGPWGPCGVPVPRQARQAPREVSREVDLSDRGEADTLDSDAPTRDGGTAGRETPSREGGTQDRADPSSEGGTQDRANPSKEGVTPDRAHPSREGGTPDRAHPSREGGIPDRAHPSREGGTPDGDKPSREGGVPGRETPGRERGAPEGDRPSREREPAVREKPSREGEAPDRASDKPSRERGTAGREKPSREGGTPTGDKPSSERGTPGRGRDKPSRDKSSRDSDTVGRGGDKMARDGEAPALDSPASEGGPADKTRDNPVREGGPADKTRDNPVREGGPADKTRDNPVREGGPADKTRDNPIREGEPGDRGKDSPAREGKKAAKGNDKPNREVDKLARANRKLRKLIRKQERASRQVDRPKRQKKAKNKEKREKIREKARERLRSEKVKDPETRELLKKKRTKNRQNRPGGKGWDIQMGYRTREVMCVHKSGDTEALSLCSQEGLPVTYQACVVTRDCEVGGWSEWSPCSTRCYEPNGPRGQRTRGRRVTQFTVGPGGAACPELEETEACSPEDGAPPCTVYSWKATEWTECRVDTLLSQQDRRRANQTGLCGGGIQGREVYCVQAGGDTPSNLSALRGREALRPVDSELCLGIPPNTTQLCQIACPVECEVSAWGAWGPCTFENCQDQTAKKGFKLRKRRITNEPTGGTGNCPHLVEAIPCEEPSCYDWLLVKLEACLPDNDKECGPGTQIPQVQCVNSDGDFVERQLCRDAILPMPAICEVPCPKDCALSPWTSWSLCSNTCSGKNTEGRQMRARSILAYNAGEATAKVVAWITVMQGSPLLSTVPLIFGGIQCPNASSLQEVRSCNEHPCTVYHWQTGPWGQCIEDASIPTGAANGSRGRGGEDSACSVGMQTRKVICVRVNVGQVPPKKCPESLRPDTVRPCLLPCRRDCVVTPYSDWSPCPSTCQAGGKTKKKQSRRRLIVQLPANGGQDCPDLLSQERDCEGPSVCQGYRWKTHKWRRCQLVPWSVRQDSPGMQETCGAGLQARAVSCRKQDGGQADIEECLKLASPMPELTQPCQNPCQEDCQLTAWSKFSACTADCVGVRTRKRLLVGKSKKREQCKINQLYPLTETQYCPCNKYNAQPVGNWSDCILPEGGRAEGPLGLKVQGDVKECGQGYRYQAMVCYDQDNRLVETTRCNSHGYIEEACIIACPSDCKLSEWSNWSRCSKSCGSGVKVRSKWLREKPYNGGRPCPKLDHVNQVAGLRGGALSERLWSVRVAGRALERLEGQQRGPEGELWRRRADQKSQVYAEHHRWAVRPGGGLPV
uniref:Thrombospondin, type I, domain containing 7Aa n=1 Tax=Gadus morhua TaxID=8049 RepID=A0A8C4ZXL8_GADMO